VRRQVVHRVAVALLKRHRRTLVALDLEGLMAFLQRQLPTHVRSDVDAVLRAAFALPVKQSDVDALEAEYWRTAGRR
jgi:hypothetical protein